jgi:hypothetical protein
MTTQRTRRVRRIVGRTLSHARLRMSTAPRRRPRVTHLRSGKTAMMHAMRLKIGLHYCSGLRLSLEIGPAWIGIIVTMAIRQVWPELAPMLPLIS